MPQMSYEQQLYLFEAHAKAICNLLLIIDNLRSEMAHGGITSPDVQAMGAALVADIETAVSIFRGDRHASQ